MCQQLPYQEESILENAQINFSVYNCVMSFKQVALLLQFHSKYTLQEFHDSFCLQNFILYSSSGGIPSSSSVKSKGSIHSISPWKTNNIFQNYIHVVLTQGPRKSRWHGWHATRQFQPTGGFHPSNQATVAMHPSIIQDFNNFQPTVL